jgi:hypothetical protein
MFSELRFLSLLVRFEAVAVFLWKRAVHVSLLLRRLMRKGNRASFAEAVLNVSVCFETSRRTHFTRSMKLGLEFNPVD